MGNAAYEYMSKELSLDRMIIKTLEAYQNKPLR